MVIKYGKVEGFLVLYLNVFGLFKIINKFFGVFFVVLFVGELRFKVFLILKVWNNVCLVKDYGSVCW